MNFKTNCCDGIYNSFDVHFTSACEFKCKHCIDQRFAGLGVTKPDVQAITDTIIANQAGYDDVLFLGGEPCMYIDELIDCIEILRRETQLKLFVTTAVPATCYSDWGRFENLISLLDGINLSVQHHKPKVADAIRQTTSRFGRNAFYSFLPMKEKIRINLNIVKPFLYERDDIIECLSFFDKKGFSSIKLSEIQHGKDCFVSFEDTFGIRLKSPFSGGCQTYIDMAQFVPGFRTPLLLKRSCFICEETLKASFMDGVKVLYKAIVPTNNKYAVVYGNGQLTKGWV